MADNFDLKKFLKDSKAIENLNPSLKAINENKEYEKDAEADDAEHIEALEKDMKDDKKMSTKESLKSQIRERILAELAEEVTTDNADQDDAALNKDYDPVYEGEEVEEAKKKDEEVEDVETTDVETTDTIEDIPAEESPAAGGGLEDVAADMEGTEGDLMDSLMKAFKIAKGMNNEKLETQVGNTLKFFVSEYIGGSEQ
jgi:hypothetical protein